MKMVTAIVKPFKLDEVREALSGIGVQGITVTGAISKALKEYCETRNDCIAITAPSIASSETSSTRFSRIMRASFRPRA